MPQHNQHVPRKAVPLVCHSAAVMPFRACSLQSFRYIESKSTMVEHPVAARNCKSLISCRSASYLSLIVGHKLLTLNSLSRTVVFLSRLRGSASW